MKALVHRFINWMDLTLWFLPLVALLYVYAKLKNTWKGNS